jgi:hypothetical protein
MERDFNGTADGDQARRALSALDADGARLAGRVITPGWYHPILGVIVAVMISGIATPGAMGFGLIVLGIVGVPVLARAYMRRAGVWISRAAGPVTRQLQRVLLAVYMVLFGAALALRLTEASPWWVLLPAASGFLLTWVAGRRYDRELRRELASSGAGV